MSATIEDHETPGGARAQPALGEHQGPRAASLRAFRAQLERDAWVTATHELSSFLAQSLMQPLFFLFVFGRVLPEIGAAGGGYGSQLLPGIIALTLFTTALQNTSLPLVIEFSFTKEIEDRLLAPLPAWAVGLEKVVFAASRAILAALLILPMAAIVLPGGLDVNDPNWLAFAALLVIGGIGGAAVGLVLGTAVPAQRISVVFALVLTPLIFTGATFYPWQGLGDLKWFQVVTLANPLTYVSEGMRGALIDGPHLGAGWVALGLAVATVGFLAAGLRGFVGRAID